MKSVLGSLVADLQLNDAQFYSSMRKASNQTKSFAATSNRHMAKAEQRWNSFSKTVGKFAKGLFSVRGAMTALAGAAGLGYLIKRNIEAADAIAKTADKIGISTDELQQYQYAGKLAGVEQRTLNMAIQRFSRRMGEAAQGTGEALKVVEKYGVKVRDSNGDMRSNAAIMADWADVIKNAESEQERLRIAFKLFDSEGAAVVNMLRDGSGALEGMMDEARSLGLVMDRDLIDKATRANDELTKLSAILKTRFTVTAAELAPYISDIAEDMSDWISENQELIAQDIPGTFKSIASAAQSTAGFLNDIANSPLWGVLKVFGPYLKELFTLPGTRTPGDFISLPSIGKPSGDLAKVRRPGGGGGGGVGGMSTDLEKIVSKEQEKFRAGLFAPGRLDEALTASGGVLSQMRGERSQLGVAAEEEKKKELEELVNAEQERFQAAIDGQSRLEEALVASEGRISQMRWQRLQTEKEADQQRYESAMNLAHGMGAISQLTARLSADGNETMFAISKAAGYAQALISVWTGAAKALELPFPANLAAMAQVIATGMGLVTNIQSQEMPSYDQGGISTTPGIYHAGVPEAHIPLKNGSVPVDIAGGSASPTYNVTINAMDAASFAQLVERNPGAITTVVEKQIRGNQKLRHTMRKYS